MIPSSACPSSPSMPHTKMNKRFSVCPASSSWLSPPLGKALVTLRGWWDNCQLFHCVIGPKVQALLLVWRNGLHGTEGDRFVCTLHEPNTEQPWTLGAQSWDVALGKSAAPEHPGVCRPVTLNVVVSCLGVASLTESLSHFGNRLLSCSWQKPAI